MKYEIYIQERKKSQKFCKKAIAEYEKRLSRYCKISCKFVKKEKRLAFLRVLEYNIKARQEKAPENWEAFNKTLHSAVRCDKMILLKSCC